MRCSRGPHYGEVSMVSNKEHIRFPPFSLGMVVQHRRRNIASRCVLALVILSLFAVFTVAAQDTTKTAVRPSPVKVAYQDAKEAYVVAERQYRSSPDGAVDAYREVLKTFVVAGDARIAAARELVETLPVAEATKRAMLDDLATSSASLQSQRAVVDAARSGTELRALHADVSAQWNTQARPAIARVRDAHLVATYTTALTTYERVLNRLHLLSERFPQHQATLKPSLSYIELSLADARRSLREAERAMHAAESSASYDADRVGMLLLSCRKNLLSAKEEIIIIIRVLEGS